MYLCRDLTRIIRVPVHGHRPRLNRATTVVVFFYLSTLRSHNNRHDHRGRHNNRTRVRMARTCSAALVRLVVRL